MEAFRPRNQFFRDIVGVNEAQFRKSRELMQKARPAPGKILNLSTQQIYQTGEFRLKTLGELRKATATPDPNRAPGTLHLLLSENDPSSLDIGRLQSLPRFRKALFQVASNFNALELMSPHDQRAMTEIGNYTLDRTQGPFASISAAPGLIARHYYAFESPNRPPDTWRQKYDGAQIEMLKATALRVTNGYVTLDKDALAYILDPEDIAVVVHRDIQVTFGQTAGSQHLRVSDTEQTIDQVFTATLDLGSRQTHFVHEHRAEVARLAKSLLRAAYESTLLAAVEGKRKEVVLTLIGGGVFQNPTEWIVETLENLVPLIVNSGLVVYLNCFRGPECAESLRRMRDLSRQTGGQELDSA